MKSERAKQYIDNNAVIMNNGDRMVDASTAYMAVEIAEQEAEKRIREELTRWHDIRTEFPEFRQELLLKMKRKDGTTFCWIGWMAGERIFAKYARGAKVVAWRYIHE